MAALSINNPNKLDIVDFIQDLPFNLKSNKNTAFQKENKHLKSCWFSKNRIEKLPIVDDSGNIRGLITSKDITNNANYPNASKDKKGRPLVGAAVGVKGDFLERSESLLNAGADVLVVDIAHECRWW